MDHTIDGFLQYFARHPGIVRLGGCYLVIIIKNIK